MINDTLLLEKIETLNSGGLLKDAQHYKCISDIMQYVHSKIPTAQKFDVTKAAAPIDIREEYFHGVNYNRAVIFLMSNGCEWALKSGNGCTVCGHLAKQTRESETIKSENFIKQFIEEFSKLNFHKTPLLNLYNNGSFFNDNEIPAEARDKMLTMINENPYIKMLVLESRPEFIQEDKMKEIKELMPDKHLEIAMGLEVVDDFLRYICLNKGFSLNKYNQAAEIITKYFKLRTYVMLKPPFLSEKESIEQAVKTISHAFRAGATTVSLETCTIQDFTLTSHLYERGFYEQAWLWSIIEVIKQTWNMGKVVAGLFQFYPSPNKVPYNCPKCSDKVLNAIYQYNRTLDISVFDDLTCDCKDEWRKELQREYEPIEKKVQAVWNDFQEIVL